MPLKSELWTFVLKILLGALVAAAAVDLVCSAVYTMDVDLFSQHFYSLYGFVDIVSVVLYYIIIVVYLIWIFRVHKDLNRLYLQYPRSPGEAMACMLIPFYSLYGLPSTYQILGSQFQRTPALRKDGQWIQGLSVPLVIFMFTANIMNRFVGNADEVSGALLFASSLLSFVLYVIFFTLCTLVSRGLNALQLRAEDAEQEPLPEQSFVREELPFPLKS